MIDSSIEYKSIILRCDRIDKSAYLELDSNVITYFIDRYGHEQDELEKRCIFLKKKSTKNTLELVWHGLSIREK